MFFNNKLTLDENITDEHKFINYEGHNYSINKSPAIYNDKSVVLCICNEIK